MTASPFSGAESLRVRGERKRLVLTLLFLPFTLIVVGFFLQNTFSIHSLILILIGAMLFVALSRGRFLGAGVRIGPGQFDHVHAIASECAALIGIEPPHVFLRDDPFVPIVAVGTGEPYALVLSSNYVELFSHDELRFLIGRELAHVAAGHTKLTSLLSANGRENAVVAIAFGAWLRWIEYSADRVGLLCCGSLNVAFNAIAVSTFHHVGRKIDLHAFAEQRREIDAEASLRMGEWLGATPYATNRIARLAAFARDPLFVRWAARFAERRSGTPSAVPAALDDQRRYAGPWRRVGAFLVDFLVVSALFPSRVDTHAANEAAGALHRPDVPQGLQAIIERAAGGDWTIAAGVGAGMLWAAIAVYVVVLVAFAGQTLGMMIFDLRVVGTGRQRVGLGRAIARYAFFLASIPLVIGIVSLFRRVQPFEKWSRTRLVNGNVVRP